MDPGAGAGAGLCIWVGGSSSRGMLEMAVMREVRNCREVGRWRAGVVEVGGECNGGDKLFALSCG